MMKNRRNGTGCHRTLTWMLVLCLLLAGCGSSSSSSDGGDAEAAETESENSQDAGSSEVGSTDEGKNGDSQGSFLSDNGENGDSRGSFISDNGNGVKIRVDYSGYTAAKGVEEKYTRLSEDPIGDLRSGEYGAIYPYVGSVLYSAGNDSYSGINGYSYGMIDETGRIIADPTYGDIRLASYWDSEHNQRIYLPVWLLARCQVNQVSEEEDMADAEWCYAAASRDGSFVTDCKYTHVLAGEFGVLLGEDYDSPDFIILDNEGKEILNSEDLNLEEQWDEASTLPYDYADGSFTIWLKGGYYYMDLSGNLTPAPENVSESFHDNRVVITDDYGRWAEMIDREGNVIIPRGTYGSISQPYDNGLILGIVWNDEGNSQYDVLDTDGNVILSKVCADLSIHDDLILAIEDSENELSEYYDLEGNLLGTLDNATILTDDGLFYIDNGSSVTLQNVLTGQSVTAESSDQVSENEERYMYCYNIPVWKSEEFETDPSFVVVATSNDTEYLLDVYDSTTLEKAAEDVESAWLCADPLTGEKWLVTSVSKSDTKYRLLNTKGEQVLSTLIQGPAAVFDNRILTVADTSGQYLDMDGNVLFCCSLLMSSGD